MLRDYPRSAQSKIHNNIQKYLQRFGELHSNPPTLRSITRKCDRGRFALIVAYRFSRDGGIQRGTKNDHGYTLEVV
jgi:hypothetical protein